MKELPPGFVQLRPGAQPRKEVVDTPQLSDDQLPVSEVREPAGELPAETGGGGDTVDGLERIGNPNALTGGVVRGNPLVVSAYMAGVGRVRGGGIVSAKVGAGWMA